MKITTANKSVVESQIYVFWNLEDEVEKISDSPACSGKRFPIEKSEYRKTSKTQVVVAMSVVLSELVLKARNVVVLQILEASIRVLMTGDMSTIFQTKDISCFIA